MEETTSQPTAQLTPRQQEVLALLREGLTNPQIAERLGVTLKAAEHHVAEVIGRLGVRNRYEAAVWPQRPPWWMAALAPVRLFMRRASSALSIKAGSLALAASAAAFLVTFAGLGIIGVLLVRGAGEHPDTAAFDERSRLIADEGCPLWERATASSEAAPGGTSLIRFGAIGSFELPDERTLVLTPRPGAHDAVVTALRKRQVELGSASVIALVGDEPPNVVLHLADVGDGTQAFDLVSNEVEPIRVPCPHGARPVPPGSSSWSKAGELMGPSPEGKALDNGPGWH